MIRGDKLFNRNSEKIKTFKRYNLQNSTHKARTLWKVAIYRKGK